MVSFVSYNVMTRFHMLAERFMITLSQSSICVENQLLQGCYFIKDNWILTKYFFKNVFIAVFILLSAYTSASLEFDGFSLLKKKRLLSKNT